MEPRLSASPAEAPGGSREREASPGPTAQTSGNPFDARVSDKEPFPAFEAALERKEDDQQDGGQLNWSIDTLAELKPLAFSPLPEQKATAAASTPQGTSASHAFFEDEKQYSVLRTPASASLPPRTPSSRPSARRPLASPSPSPSPSPLPSSMSTPLELHRRCRETIARCEAQLRERQRKMERLQTALPTASSSARSPRHGHKQQQRQKGSTPPRAAKRNRLSGASTSAGTRQLRWSASPIAPAAAQTPSASADEQRASFGLSPIAPSPSPERKDPSIHGEKTPPNEAKWSGSLAAVSAEMGKENDAPQSPPWSSGTASSASPPSPAACGASKASLTSPSSRLSIPRRQQAFMAAIEAEAGDLLGGEARRTDALRPAPVATASPILALHQEAKRLGVTDPQAQWEYVQLLLGNRPRYEQQREHDKTFAS